MVGLAGDAQRVRGDCSVDVEAALLQGRHLFLHARRVDDAGGDGIHADPLGSEFICESTRECDDRALRCRVGGDVCTTADSCDRRKVDDCSPLFHVTGSFTSGAVLSAHVHFQHLRHECIGDVLDRPRGGINAGVVHEDVEISTICCRNNSVDKLIGVRDVTHHERAADCFCGGGAFGIEVGNRDACTGGGQAFGNGLSDSLGASRDKRLLARKIDE